MSKSQKQPYDSNAGALLATIHQELNTRMLTEEFLFIQDVCKNYWDGDEDKARNRWIHAIENWECTSLEQYLDELERFELFVRKLLKAFKPVTSEDPLFKSCKAKHKEINKTIEACRELSC